MIDVGAMVASLTLDTKRFIVGIQKSTKAIKPLQARLVVLGQTVKKFAKMLFNLRTAFLALAVAMAGRKIMGAFQKFQTVLVDMGKVTSRSIAGIRKEVMALSTSLGTSTDLMKGYYQVISAGVKTTAKQLNVLTIATKASLAAHIDQSEVIKGLTAIVDAYEGKVKGAAEAADILFTIERLGKTTVAELIPVIGSLASISATLKISQDELGGSLAQLTKFIGSTAEAATQLKALYTALITPNKELNDLFEEQGGVLEAIRKIGFVEVLKKMEAATGGNVEALKKLMEGRREALLGFLSLAKQGFQPVIANIKEMEEKLGAMDEAFKKWKLTLEATYLVFKATIGKVMIEMGRELFPMVQAAILRVAEWLEKYQDAIVATTRALVKFLPKIAKLVAVFVALKAIVSITLLFKGFMAAVYAAEVAVIRLSTAMKANLAIIAGIIAYKIGEWFGDWIDGTIAAKEATKEIREEIARTQEKIDLTKKSLEMGAIAFKKWADAAGVALAKVAASTAIREIRKEIRGLKQDIDDLEIEALVSGVPLEASAELEILKRLLEVRKDLLGIREADFKIMFAASKVADKKRKKEEVITPVVTLTTEQITSFKEGVDSIYDYFNEATMSNFNFQELMLERELAAYIALANKKADILTAAGASSVAAEREAATLRAFAMEAYYVKLKALDEERAKAKKDILLELTETEKAQMQAMKQWAADEDAAFVQAEQEKVALLAWFAEEHAKIGKTQSDLEEERIFSVVEALREAGIEKVKIDKWVDDRITKMQTGTTPEALTATRNMYEDMKSYSGEYYDTVNKLIDIQTEKYAKLTKDEVLASKWGAAEKKKVKEAERELNMNMIAGQMSDLASFAKWMSEENKEWFIWFKRLAIAETIISTILAAQKSFAWASGWGGPIAGAIAATVAALAGFARVAQISSQTYAAGGWLDRHPEGGKVGEGSGTRDDVFLTATPGVRHWVMKDEYVFVMNKKSTKEHGAMLEAMNQGLAGGGWVDRGYGFFSDIWDVFTGGGDEVPPTPTAPVISFADVQYEIRQMMDDTTALGEVLRSTGQKFEKWYKDLQAAGATAEELALITLQRAEAEEYLTAKMKDKVWKDVNKQVSQLTGEFTDLEWKILDIEETFRGLEEDLADVGEAADLSADKIKAMSLVIEKLVTGLVESLTQQEAGLILDTDRLAMYELTQEFIATIEEIKAWADLTGENYEDLISQAQRVYDLEMEAALAQSAAAKEIESSISQWTSIVEGISDQIYQLQITLTNPADVLERMGIVSAAITGFGDVTTPEQAEGLQQLWMDYLNLAQKAYQRPSSEYQVIYDTVIEALEDISDDAEAFASAYEINLDQLVTQEMMLTALGSISASEIEALQLAGVQGSLLIDLASLSESELATLQSQGGTLIDISSGQQGLLIDLDSIAASQITSMGLEGTMVQDLNDISANIMAGIPVALSLTTDDFNVVVDVDIPDTEVTVTIPDIPDVEVDLTTSEELMREQKTVLEQIRANTYAIGINTATHWVRGGVDMRIIQGTNPPYAEHGGIFSGPESGYPVIMHGTEAVIPLNGGSTGIGKTEFNLTLNIDGSRTPQETGREAVKQTEAFLRSARGRKMVQQASVGR